MKKPNPGKVKVKFEDAEITEDGMVILSLEVTHPQERKGEIIEFQGRLRPPVDTVVLARTLCLQWVSEQDPTGERGGQYVFDKDQEDSVAFWHAQFWREQYGDIDVERLEADWDTYWEGKE